MNLKAKIMDEAAMQRSLARITHEIIEKNLGAEKLCLLGIKRRGVPLAQQLAENIERFEQVKVPVGHIDITLYRDDLTELTNLPVSKDCCIPCDLKNTIVIIVDDVLYTGRTARAAIEAVFSYGRPKAIQLAVLIDRGHRELPIRADYVGKNIPTANNEVVSVKTLAFDGENSVCIYQNSKE